MNTVQLVLAGLFVVALAVTYRDKLLSLIRRADKTVTGGVTASIAVPLVDDIIAVTKLRDKLAAEGCGAGVEACTSLLRVIVEYEQPSKGVV
jgi:hypothetical protein